MEGLDLLASGQGDQWLAIVNAVMNYRVQQIVANLLISLGAIGLEEMTFILGIRPLI
jgi:hypothetical protein